MKRDILRFTLIAAVMTAVLSCGSLRHAPQDPLSKSETDRFAANHLYMEGVRMYSEGRYDAALDLMSQSLDYDSASAATCYHLAQFYLSMSDRAVVAKYGPLARTLMQRAVRLDPDNYWYRRLLAMSYLRRNNPKEAIKEYEEIVRRFPSRTDALMTLAGLYNDINDFENELRVLKRYGRLEDMDDELKFQRFLCYLQMGQMDSAYYEADNPSEVIELLMKTSRDMIEHAETPMERAQCRSTLDIVMNFCDVVSKYEPELMAPYSQKSVVYFWLGETDKSLEILAKGLSNVKTDKGKATLYNIRGDFYHTLRDKNRMYADYDSTLMYDPDNIAVLNNYAYYLSLDNRDLERALSMSGRTLEAEPLNATYLDTYAWILFRMKRYKEALGYMEKALRYLDSDNPEIYEHYGDVLYMCGEKEKAVDSWHKALQYHSESTTIEQKIKQQKYLE